jgi:glucokinase
MQFASKLFLIIDIGGTHIKCAILSGAGEIISRDTYDTPKDYENFIAVIRREIDMNPVSAVQMSLPGIYDVENDRSLFITNIQYLQDRQIVKDIDTTVPIFISNDADMATVGEYALGFDKPPKSMVLLTLGTGVGSGVVFNHKLIEGTEIGHATLVAEGRPCNCGKKGCVEKYCATGAIISDYIEGSGDDQAKDVRYVAERAREGDFAAYGAFEFFAMHLAHTVASVINIFNPQYIRIGGGISELADLYFPSMLDMLSMMTFPVYVNSTDVSVAKLKNDAALYGGLEWIRQNLEK